MNKRILDVTMFPLKGNTEILNEIEKEYISSGHSLRSSYERDVFDNCLMKQFDKIDFISHALKMEGNHTVLHLVQKGTRFGIFSGKSICIVIPIKYFQLLAIDFGNNIIQFMAMNEDFKWGLPKIKSYWCEKDKEILPCKFDDIKKPTEDFYPVNIQGKWGLYYSRMNEMIIEPQYEDALQISEGLWGVKKEGLWGFVDIFNTIIIPFKYEKISIFKSGYAQAVSYSFMENEGIVLLDHNGNDTIFRKKQLIDDNVRSSIRIKESYDNHIRYYYVEDSNEEIIIPKNKYRYLGCYSEGLLAASLDGKTYGYIDINEKVIIPFQYQLETYPSVFNRKAFHWGIACVKLNKKNYSRELILINHNNQQLFPYVFQCDDLEYKNHFFYGPAFYTIGDRFKRNNISLHDLINYKQGKNMCYLIRTDAELEAYCNYRMKQQEKEIPYEWTAEDTWDAMTDGMYGDYPGGDVDYEKFGF